MQLLDPQDQRKFRRYQMPKAVSMTAEGRTFGCALIDISAGGAMFNSCYVPEEDYEATVEIPMVGSLSGKVVRTMPLGFAVEFDQDESVLSDLWACLMMMEAKQLGPDQMEEILFPLSKSKANRFEHRV